MKKVTSVFLLFAASSMSWGYERATHEALSEAAADASTLNNPQTLVRLGMAGTSIRDSANLFSTSEGGTLTILRLIRFGADWEDGRGEKVQATRHFFNPVTGDALSVGPYVLTTPPFFVPKFSGIRSPDWALDDIACDPGNLGLPQRFSYKLARRYFLDAVRLPEKTDRDANWGLTFQSLGHVIHHIQDMAQPQHTRNDRAST